MSGSVRSFLATGLILGLSAFSLAQDTKNVSSSACPAPGAAHIIVARASTEAPGFGVIGAVKDNVLTAVPGSTAEAVVYPATLSAYFDSETTGVIAMRKLINAWASNCQGSPLVIMGYSQGAQVTADSIVGQEVDGFPDNSTVMQALDASIFPRIAAVIMMGDPSADYNQSFHVGTAKTNSIFPRRNSDLFNTAGLASRTQSYCNDGDPYCAAGNQIIVHLEYVEEFGTNATNFVVNNIKNWYGGNGTTTGSNSTLPVASGTAAGSRTRTATGTGVVGPTGGAGNSSTATGTAGSGTTPTAATSPIATATGNAAIGVRELATAGTTSFAIIAGLFAWLL